MINLQFSNIQELINVELYIKKDHLNNKDLKHTLIETTIFYYQVTYFDKLKEKYNFKIDIDISGNILKFKIDERIFEKLKIPFVVADFHTNETGIYHDVKIICEINSDIVYLVKKNDKKYIYKNKIIYI